MGAEHMVPGKSTKVASVDTAAPQQQRADVGKVSRVSSEAAAPAEQDKEKPAKKPSQIDRAKLIGLVSSAVGRCHTAYMAALGSLELEHKIENESELPLWAGVLLAGGGKFFEIAFGMARKALCAADAIGHELESAGVAAMKGATEGLAKEMTHELHDKTIEAVIGLSVDAGKESVKAPIGKAIAGSDKDVALGYIDRLKDGSMVMFEQLAEKVYDLDDAELVAAHRALAAKNILYSRIKVFLEEKISAFMKTRIRDIGKREGSRRGTLEHKVGWMYEPGASKPRLIYVDDVFDAAPRADPGPAYDSVPRLSLGQTGTWVGTVDNETNENRHPQFSAHAHEAGPRFVGPVEEEFEKDAVAQHTAQWLTAPRNYRQITNDGAPRLEAM